MTRKPPARLSRPPTPPGSPAPAHGDGPTGPNAPTGRTGLRDRIAEVLYRHTMDHAAGGPARLLTRDETVLWENSLARADAVMAVVEAETADRPDWRPAYDRLAHALTEALTRAETAERQREQALDQIADERRGKLAAEAAARRVQALIDSYPPGSRFARSGAQALFRAALDAEQPKETP